MDTVRLGPKIRDEEAEPGTEAEAGGGAGAGAGINKVQSCVGQWSKQAKGVARKERERGESVQGAGSGQIKRTD